LLNLIEAVQPRVVNPSLVTPGATADDRMLNAKYAISLARKIDCTIFLVWEDIVEVKPKMILTLVGSLMALDSRKANRRVQK
jgi:plastin-1